MKNYWKILDELDFMPECRGKSHETNKSIHDEGLGSYFILGECPNCGLDLSDYYCYTFAQGTLKVCNEAPNSLYRCACGVNSFFVDVFKKIVPVGGFEH